MAVELFKSHPAMPVLFVSGTPIYAWDASDLRNFHQLQPDRTDFLEKPFRASALLDNVSRLLTKMATYTAFPQ